MATQVVELTGDEAKLLRSYNNAIAKQAELEAKLRAGGAAGDAAGTQIEDALLRVKRANDQALKGLLGELKSMGAEAAPAAEALKTHFADAGKAGFRSMGTVLDQIRKIDPAAAEAASAAQASFTASANSTENQFRKVLNQLQAMSPAGAKAADAIKAKFVEAGHITERSLADVAKGFEAIDPEAAKAAQSIIENMDEAGEQTKEIWGLVTEDMVAKIGTVGAAAAVLKLAVSAISEELQFQKQMVADAREANLSLAEAEQDAFKNMAGFSKEDQDTLLKQVVPDVQKATNFPERKSLVIATGALASADAPVEKIQPMLEATAPLTRLNPSETDEYAMGGFNISKITGLGAKESLNLMLTAGGKALVKDPRDVAESLPPAMLATINTSKTQDKELAGRQGAALYALSTDLGGDVTGAKSQTNVATLSNYLDKLFETGNTELNKAIERAEKAIAAQTEKIASLKDRGADSKKILAEETDLQKTRTELGELTAKRATIPKDPGLPFERIKAIQENELLREQYLSRTEGGVPGEAALLSSNRALADPNSDAWKKLQDKFAGIQNGQAAYNLAVSQTAGGTSATLLASTDATARSLTQQSELADQERATLGQVREVVDAALKHNENWYDRAGAYVLNGILTGGGWLSSGTPLSIENGRLQGTTAAEEAVSGIRELASLRNTTTDPAKRDQLQVAIESLQQLITKQAALLDAAGVARAQRRALMPGDSQQDAATERLLQQIANELGAIRANTGKAPPVTGALGSGAAGP